jgi:hypothetical protein
MRSWKWIAYSFPPLTNQPPCNRRSRAKGWQEASTVANAAVPGALAAPVMAGRIPICSWAPPIFTAVVTAGAIDQQLHDSNKAHQAQGAQSWGPSGRTKPGHSRAPLGFTDVVVTHNGGSDNEEAKQAFCCKNPVDIVQAAQCTLNKALRNPPLILQGRWLETVAKTGNFVYHFAGKLSTEAVLSFLACLLENFPGEAWLVPTKGWTWVQLRGVDVSYTEDGVAYLYDGQDLLKAFAANPCFQGADIFVPPHWQGNPLNFKGPVATVIVAIGDVGNTRCQRASLEGVCMFGQQVKFVQAGDSPSLVQCSRCHKLRHYFSSPKCCLAADAVRCYKCGGPHDSCTHDFKCTKTHKVVGKCDCMPKCLLCKQAGHDACNKKCPLQGNFVPP